MAVSHRGAISFGLVHIPVGLYTATQDNDIHFNQLCREDVLQDIEQLIKAESDFWEHVRKKSRPALILPEI